VRAATDEELLEVKGVSPTLVAALRSHLGADAPEQVEQVEQVEERDG
jgi:hypothetical protein